MNSLREAVIDYLATRRSSGFKLRAAGYGLLRFVSYMEARDCSYVTTALAVEWATQASCAQDQELASAQYLGFVREFSKFRIVDDPRTEIPSHGLLPYPTRRLPKLKVTRKEMQEGSTVPATDSHRGWALREAIAEYLAMRRALGFKLRLAGKALVHFASFMEERGAEYITVPLALEWAQKPASANTTSRAKRLGFVRQFAQYRIAADSRTEIPAWNIIPYSTRRARPYLYTDEEIQRLLGAALNLPVNSSPGVLRRQTYYCLFGLLAVSGMRVGEAINLKLSGVDLSAGVLTLEGGKFGQSRLVPVHPSTLEALSNYKSIRDDYLNTRGFSSDYFFTTHFGGRLDGGDVHCKFYILSKMIGLRGDGPNNGPRIHDLRHRFAVETLLRWYRNGEDVERMLPVLSTYLGHVKVKDTYWYLTACPELMGQAVRLVEQRWEEGQ